MLEDEFGNTLLLDVKKGTEELHRANNDLKNIDETFTTMVNKISVEMIGKKEE